MFINIAQSHTHHYRVELVTYSRIVKEYPRPAPISSFIASFRAISCLISSCLWDSYIYLANLLPASISLNNRATSPSSVFLYYANNSLFLRFKLSQCTINFFCTNYYETIPEHALVCSSIAVCCSISSFSAYYLKFFFLLNTSSAINMPFLYKLAV